MFGWLVLTLRNYRIGTTHKNHVPSPTHPPKKENIEETKIIIIIIITSSHSPVGFLKKKKKKKKKKKSYALQFLLYKDIQIL
jgi:hypothetical protein